MKTVTKPDVHQFLAGGGEMGHLIRAKDWSRTSLGSPDVWPQSLRTALSILLNSKFPMFLWWGAELICFYNDAYRPSLGENGKHPFILGIPAQSAWEEIWTIIKPLIDQVLTRGEATWSEDQLIPIYRNGRMEDVYWTFSYSPVNDESGHPAGVLVICNETTHKVQRFNEIAARESMLVESEKQFRHLVMQSPVPMTILKGRDFVIEMANRAMLERWKRDADEVLGKKMTDVFPEISNQKYPALLNKVLTSGQHHGERESVVYMRHGNNLVRTFLDYEYAPFFERDGSVSGVVVTVNDVTEKVEARRKVENAEERLRLATEATGIATWEIDVQAKKMQHSARFAEIFGHDGSVQLSYEQLLAQVHPDDRNNVAQALIRAMATAEYSYEARIIKPDTTTCWVKSQGRIFYVEDDQPLKLIGTLRDITDEKTQQQELQEQERRFRLLADTMPQLVWTADAEGKLNYFNQAVYNYSGLSHEQIINDGWLQIVHPADREENVKRWQESVSTGKDFFYEHRFRRYDGVYRWQVSRAVPQTDAAGNILMWVGSSTDIEHQKSFAAELERQVNEQTRQLQQSHEELIKSEERYHLMVGEVQDYAIIFLSQMGIVENWNKGAEKIKGYTAEEIIGRSFSTFYTPEDRARNLPETLLNKAKITGKATQEGWRVKKDGTRFWASVVITALHNSQSEIIGFSKVTRDLTERRAAEDRVRAHAIQLEQKSRELEKMNAELQSFAYISSHDLQEPLRKIQTFSSRIQEIDADRLSEKGKDYFRRMQDAANRMQTLIEDLLAYSRTNSSERIFVKTNLHAIVDEVKQEMKETIAEHGASVFLGKDVVLEIIPFQFRQLLQNLISNALKFARPGVTPEIRICSEKIKAGVLPHAALQPGKTYCHITISDNGIGFDQQYSERIFEVFQRLHGKDEYRGTGIGLAIVKKIVENHDGIIKAHGAPGEGARFDIYIPVSKHQQA